MCVCACVCCRLLYCGSDRHLQTPLSAHKYQPGTAPQLGRQKLLWVVWGTTGPGIRWFSLLPDNIMGVRRVRGPEVHGKGCLEWRCRMSRMGFRGICNATQTGNYCSVKTSRDFQLLSNFWMIYKSLCGILWGFKSLPKMRDELFRFVYFEFLISQYYG